MRNANCFVLLMFYQEKTSDWWWYKFVYIWCEVHNVKWQL